VLLPAHAGSLTRSSGAAIRINGIPGVRDEPSTPVQFTFNRPFYTIAPA
jgi:hypothetical protein